MAQQHDFELSLNSDHTDLHVAGLQGATYEFEKIPVLVVFLLLRDLWLLTSALVEADFRYFVVALGNLLIDFKISHLGVDDVIRNAYDPQPEQIPTATVHLSAELVEDGACTPTKE